MGATGSRLARLTCRACCQDSTPDVVRGTCPVCGHALLAAYDLRGLDGREWWARVTERPATLWRYLELLPIRDNRNIVSLGEARTPILRLHPPDEAPDLQLFGKDDGRLPTGSFKARGMAMAISRAQELGVRTVFVPSAGNAGLAAAAYGARAGMVVRVYVPRGTPPAQRRGAGLFGAEVTEVGNTLRETGEAARTAEARRGSFDLSTLREPYRIEGKKTMGFEIFDELGADGVPDAIVYPTGGGTGLVGLAKAFHELRELGLVDRAPRLYAVQPEGCAPIVRALEDGESCARPWDDPATSAPGLLVPSPFASERVLEAVRGSRGGGVRVPEALIQPAVLRMARRDGIWVSPEAGAAYAALPLLCRSGAVHPGERVLVYLTGSGLPFPPDVRPG